MDDNIFQSPYIYLPPTLGVPHTPRAPNDVTHAAPVWSIYDRTDYLVNMDLSITQALARPYRISAVTEPLLRTGLPPNDSRPIDTPLAVWRSKFSLDKAYQHNA